ncbi:hypothetical protein M885DRAFT_508369 [Pelagophyceae sp. CCMP2097]|nr:hypothetical protein M885DRAFT_508369 [Pelagophyceae sp. CCMP2097]
MLFYTRASAGWSLEASRGSGASLARLARWAALPTPRVFESLRGRAFACFVGSLARATLWVLVQRRRPRLAPRPWPRAAVRLANFALAAAWPRLRVAINDAVEISAPAAADALLRRTARPPVQGVSALQMDVGPYPPEVTAFSLSPSLSGGSMDVDVDVSAPGDGVRLALDLNLAGSPGVSARVEKCAVSASMRLKLGPLITPLPCFGFVRVGFSAPPKLDFKVEPAGLGAVFLEDFIAGVVEATLWPKCCTVPVASLTLGDAYAARLAAPSRAPIGSLSLEVHSCARLLIDGAAGEDACVVARLAGTEARTVCRGAASSVDAASQPRTFVFDVHASSQACTLKVFASEAASLDPAAKPLGVGSFRVDDLAAAGPAARSGRRRRSSAVELRVPLESAGALSEASATVLARFTLSDSLEEAASTAPVWIAAAVACAAFAFIVRPLVNSQRLGVGAKEPASPRDSAPLRDPELALEQQAGGPVRRRRGPPRLHGARECFFRRLHDER